MRRRIKRPGLSRCGYTPGKYGSRKVEWDGIKFHSKAEGMQYLLLKAMKAAGEIRDFRRQVRFELGSPPIVYVADFVVIDKCGVEFVLEVKGAWTPIFRQVVKHWRAVGPMRMVIRTQSWGKWTQQIVDPEPHW